MQQNIPLLMPPPAEDPELNIFDLNAFPAGPALLTFDDPPENIPEFIPSFSPDPPAQLDPNHYTNQPAPGQHQIIPGTASPWQPGQPAPGLNAAGQVVPALQIYTNLGPTIAFVLGNRTVAILWYEKELGIVNRTYLYAYPKS